MQGHSGASIVANLQELCSVCGVSGFECQTGISEFLYQKARTICLNTHRDKKGNIISIVGTGNTKVLIDAHMDEVGFSIIGLSKDGIELRPIGVFTLSRIAGEGVFIIGKNVTGVLKIYDECIFFVPDSPDDTHKCAIHDLVSFKRTFQIQPNNEIEATALDNRVGCAILLELLENIIPPENATFVYVFSVQEEINNSNLNEIILHYGIDYGIVVESAYALPVHFDTKGMIIPELGQGCAIQHQGENFIIHEDIIQNIISFSQQRGIRIQHEIPSLHLGRTNCSRFYQDTLCCAINVPVRNQHVSRSQVNVDDIIETYTLITHILCQYQVIFEKIR